MTIVEFLMARMDETEARAKLAASIIGTKAFVRSWGPWDSWEIIAQQLLACCDTVPQIDRAGQFLQADADPARVLREVAAKRRTLARHSDDGYGNCQGCGHEYADISLRYTIDECPELRDLVAPYADYNPAWRVE